MAITYWELTNNERAVLTREEVEGFLRAELMEKGIVRPVAPVLKPVEVVDVKKDQVFGIEYEGRYSYHKDTADLVFSTSAQAQAVLEQNPMWVRDSDGGSDYKYATPLAGAVIKPLTVCAEQDIVNVQSRLKQAAENQNANDAAKHEYNEAMNVVEKATQGLWDDWYRQVGELEKCQRVKDVYAEYVLTCDGNENVAFKFLLKAYSIEQIAKANEWLGLGLDGLVSAEEINTHLQAEAEEEEPAAI
jgi:hypothetical protein